MGVVGHIRLIGHISPIASSSIKVIKLPPFGRVGVGYPSDWGGLWGVLVLFWGVGACGHFIKEYIYDNTLTTVTLQNNRRIGK